jgi:hypothetical protein
MKELFNTPLFSTLIIMFAVSLPTSIILWLVKRFSSTPKASDGFITATDLKKQCENQRNICKSFAAQDDKTITRLNDSLDGLHKKFDDFRESHHRQHTDEQREISRAMEKSNTVYLENIEKVTAKSIETLEAIKKGSVQ